MVWNVEGCKLLTFPCINLMIRRSEGAWSTGESARYAGRVQCCRRLLHSEPTAAASLPTWVLEKCRGSKVFLRAFIDLGGWVGI